jgi:hypothetical protein
MGERRQTMAQMLERLRSQPPALPPGGGLVAVPDTRTGVDLPGPAGELFARVARDVPPGQAVTLLRAGALVAWDSCGCGGYCGFDWLDVDRRQSLLRADRPRVGGRAKKGQWGTLSHWRSPAGTDLLLAENYVHWGTELA